MKTMLSKRTGIILFASKFWTDKGYTLSSWHFMAATYDGATKKYHLYLDGALAKCSSASCAGTVGTATAAALSPACNLFIGMRDPKTYTSVPEYIDAKIDEVGVWERALTQAEISKLYNNGTGYNPLAVAP